MHFCFCIPWIEDRFTSSSSSLEVLELNHSLWSFEIICILMHCLQYQICKMMEMSCCCWVTYCGFRFSAKCPLEIFILFTWDTSLMVESCFPLISVQIIDELDEISGPWWSCFFNYCCWFVVVEWGEVRWVELSFHS